MSPSRREFLERGAAAAVGAAVLSSAAFASKDQTRALPRRWTWVHGGREGSAADWRQRFSDLREAGIDGVLVSGGDAALLSDAARGAGLAFHRWIWTLNRSGDRQVKADHPDWFTVSRNGESSLTKPPYVGYYQWLCPSRPEVRAYLRGVVDELAKDTNLDGVHLDYVRHCDVILPIGLWPKYNLVQDHEMAEFDFCYCEVCVDTFRAQSGRDPRRLADPSKDDAWRRFRWDSVTGLVRVLAEAVHARNMPITAAVFPTPAIARTLVRQAWDEWPLDAVFPMLYHGFYNEPVAWIGRSVREGLAALPPGRALFAGLYLPDLPPDQLALAVRTALDAGAAGVSVFDMNGLTQAHRKAMGGVGRGFSPGGYRRP